MLLKLFDRRVNFPPMTFGSLVSYHSCLELRNPTKVLTKYLCLITATDYRSHGYNKRFEEYSTQSWEKIQI